MLTIFMAMLFVSVTIYWLLYPYKLVDFKNEPFSISNPRVKGGEHLAINVDYCKYTDLSPVTNISFVDGFIYNTTPQVTNAEKGCHTIVYQVYVTKAIPAGTYKLHGVFHYKVNPIRTVDITASTQQFEVIK